MRPFSSRSSTRKSAQRRLFLFYVLERTRLHIYFLTTLYVCVYNVSSLAAYLHHHHHNHRRGYLLVACVVNTIYRVDDDQNDDNNTIIITIIILCKHVCVVSFVCTYMNAYVLTAQLLLFWNKEGRQVKRQVGLALDQNLFIFLPSPFFSFFFFESVKYTQQRGKKLQRGRKKLK